MPKIESYMCNWFRMLYMIVNTHADALCALHFYRRPPAPINMLAYTHSQSTTLDTLDNRDGDAPLVLFEGRVRVTFL